MEFEKLSEKVIGLAIEVHRNLGPGLLESTYKQCIAYELTQAKLKYQMETKLPIKYKNIHISSGYRIDLLIENNLILEIKCVDKFHPVHEAQLLTYMKHANIKTGLLLNFNTKILKDGIKRYVL